MLTVTIDMLIGADEDFREQLSEIEIELIGRREDKWVYEWRVKGVGLRGPGTGRVLSDQRSPQGYWNLVYTCFQAALRKSRKTPKQGKSLRHGRK